MIDEQVEALETDEIIEEEETEVTELETDEVIEEETDEIVLEGEEKPTSEKPVPLKSFLKRVDKLNGKVKEANSEAEAERKRAEMLEEENKLLRLKAQQDQTPTKPKYEDFDTDAEFEAAEKAYNEKLIAEAVAKQTEQILTERTNATTQQQQADQFNAKLTAHYERAIDLKVNDYEEVEDKAIETLGKEAAKQIMASTDKSHILMYHLGKNLDKAEALAQLLRSEPVKGVLEIGRLEASLKIKPKRNNAPEPETKVNGSAQTNKYQSGQGAKYE